MFCIICQKHAQALSIQDMDVWLCDTHMFKIEPLSKDVLQCLKTIIVEVQESFKELDMFHIASLRNEAAWKRMLKENGGKNPYEPPPINENSSSS